MKPARPRGAQFPGFGTGYLYSPAKKPRLIHGISTLIISYEKSVTVCMGFCGNTYDGMAISTLHEHTDEEVYRISCPPVTLIACPVI
jgi:hypothetical protein